MAESQRMSGVRRHDSGVRARVRRAHAARLLGVPALLLGGTWIVTAGAARAGQAGTGAGSGWKVERTPNQNRDGAGINQLSAVSCSSWRLVTAPHPAGFLSGALNGVSCVLARCTAVGAWSGGPIFIATLALAN